MVSGTDEVDALVRRDSAFITCLMCPVLTFLSLPFLDFLWHDPTTASQTGSVPGEDFGGDKRKAFASAWKDLSNGLIVCVMTSGLMFSGIGLLGLKVTNQADWSFVVPFCAFEVLGGSYIGWMLGEQVTGKRFSTSYGQSTVDVAKSLRVHAIFGWLASAVIVLYSLGA